ncbi:response regulator transcription factor [uncultured Tateyamaria sp.]|uniref:response regulator transcription factor n=1 Tax=uncultured Tateyamaria sp. TaxID=455651 RepID=UPI00262299B2|nr:response regulator transcription factor [uncultured Tateyamaria sp.]
MKVLIVDDDAALSSSLDKVLRVQGYVTDKVFNLEEAYAATDVYAYDAVLLDRHLPDGDGLELLRQMRESADPTPVLLMSAARPKTDDRIFGLRSGADDYLSKPMSLDELSMRLKCILRRPRKLQTNMVEIGNLAFDLDQRQAMVDGLHLPLAARELSVLECLVRAANRVVRRQHIEESAYGFDDAASANAIDVSMHRLRSQLKKAGSTGQVHTLRGIGYILSAGQA